MLRVILAVTAAVLLTPALANAGTNAATIRGTVAVKQAHRHVLVIASRHGKVESARVTARQLRHARVGERVALTGRRLADGSLHVTKLRRIGSAKRARLTVVILKTKARHLLVAGGGSAFSIRLSRGTASARPGHEVKADVELSDEGPVGTKVEDAGEAPVIDFSGVVTAIGTTSFTVKTDGIATVVQLPDGVVQLPDGVVLPAVVQVGSEVEVVAAIDGSALTLEAIKLDDDNPGDDGGVDVDQGKVKAEGFVTALDTAAGSITVQPGEHASPVTFAIPTGFTLPAGLAVGSVVEARGEMVDGVLTLTRIEFQNEDGDQEVEAEGTVTALDTATGSITIQSSGGDDSSDDDGGGGGGGGATFTFAIPSGFALPDGLAVGSSVEARGDIVDGVLTLTRIKLEDDGGDG